LDLLASLPASGYGPVAPAALGQVLEAARDEWRNLRRWQESGQPRQWVEAHDGRWDRDDLQELVDALWLLEFWPLDPRAVERHLEAQRRDHLDRWEDEATLLRFPVPDRKSTRLNSSHSQISYAVFCLKKKSSGPMPTDLGCLFLILYSLC